MPLNLEEAKKKFKKGRYVWIRVYYSSFIGTERLFHLRISEVCEEGIRIDTINSTDFALPYDSYGICWEVFKSKADGMSH